MARRQADRSRIARVRRHKATHFGFCYAVIDSGGQALRGLAAAARHLHGRHVALERHIAVGAIFDCRASQRYRECEFLGQVRRRRALDRLMDCQFARLPGVRERRRSGCRLDRSGHLLLVSFELVVDRFNHRVGHALRQSGDRLGLFALDGDCSLAVGEGDLLTRVSAGHGELSADLLVQQHREGESLLLFRGHRAHNRLADRHAALVACVLKGGFTLTVGCNAANVAGRSRIGKASHLSLGHLVSGTCGQAGQQRLVSAVQLNGGCTAGYFHSAVGAVSQRRAVRVLQFDREGEFNTLVGRIDAHDRLADLQLAGFILILNQHRVRFRIHRIGYDEDACCIIQRNGECHYLSVGVVCHPGRLCIRRRLLHGEGIHTRRGDVADQEALQFIPLQRQSRRADSHSLRANLLRIGFFLCQRHSEVFIAGVFSRYSLLHRNLEVYSAVIQFGQENQRRSVFFGLLDCLRFADLPGCFSEGEYRSGLQLGRAVKFNPPICVTHALIVHLRHADRDCGPVVRLVQFDDGVCSLIIHRAGRHGCRFRLRRVGFGREDRISLRGGAHVDAADVCPAVFVTRRSRALQLDGQFQIILRNNLAVHQPLLGHGDAELAAGIGVHNGGFRAALAGGGFLQPGHSRRVFLAAQIRQEGHVAHVAGFIIRTNFRTLVVRDFDHGILARGQVFEGNLVGIRRVDGKDRRRSVFAHQNSIRNLLAHNAVRAGHPVGGTVDNSLNLYIEFLACVAGALVRTVDEHMLIHFKLARVAGVGERGIHARGRDRSARAAACSVGRVRCRSSRAGIHLRGHAVHAGFNDGVIDAGRQAFDRHGDFAVRSRLQRHGGYTVSEYHSVRFHAGDSTAAGNSSFITICSR